MSDASDYADEVIKLVCEAHAVSEYQFRSPMIDADLLQARSDVVWLLRNTVRWDGRVFRDGLPKQNGSETPPVVFGQIGRFMASRAGQYMPSVLQLRNWLKCRDPYCPKTIHEYCVWKGV